MAKKYFVYDGMEFETLSIPRNRFSGFSTTEGIDAVRIETATENLGQDTIVGSTDSAADRLTTMKALWTDTGLGNQYQEFARQALNRDAPLAMNGSLIADVDSSSETGTFHDLSHQYILPEGLSFGMTPLPDAIGDVADARKRSAVRNLSVRHDNIQKHDSAADAWRAYVRLELAEEASGEQMIAARSYYITPPPTQSGD